MLQCLISLQASNLLLKHYGLIAFSVEKVRCERVIPPHIFRLNFSKTAGSRIRLTSVGCLFVGAYILLC